MIRLDIENILDTYVLPTGKFLSYNVPGVVTGQILNNIVGSSLNIDGTIINMIGITLINGQPITYRSINF